MSIPPKGLDNRPGSTSEFYSEPWQGGAWFSPDGSERYLLWRHRGCVAPEDNIVFCMLNPSTAGAEPDDDATIRKLKGFVSRWGGNSFSVINLSSEIATDPTEAEFSSRATFNEDVWRHVLSDAHVVCAWGAHSKVESLRYQFLRIARASDAKLECLGLTKGGHPRHPGRISYDAPLRRYAP